MFHFIQALAYDEIVVNSVLQAEANFHFWGPRLF